MLPHSNLTLYNDEADLLHFLRVFLNELLGRYFHLQQFVALSSREAGGRPPALLSEYSKHVQTNLIDLIKWSPTLVGLPTEKLEKKWLARVFPALIERSRGFQRLHRTLRWFSEPWPEVELFQFLSRVFTENKLQSDFRKLNGSIVFNDEFNFVTYDIGYLKRPGPRLGLKLWALPKSESTNPLLWPVLIHEVAHSYFEEEEVFQEVRTLTKDPHEQNLLLRWGIELNADLFGYNLLGPAYLYSLIYFSIFFVPDNLHHPTNSFPGKEDSRSLHPPPATRIDLLLNELSSLKFDRADSHRVLKESLDPATKLFWARLELDSLERNFEPEAVENSPHSQDLLRALWERLKSLQSRKLAKQRVLTDPQLESTSILTARLDEKLLAGSIVEDRNCQDARAYVEFFKGDTTDIEKGAVRARALSCLNETPARMIDIINAGWTNKFHNLRHGYEFEYEIGEELGAKVTKIRDCLVEPARQLQKSIQVAVIFSSLHVAVTQKGEANEAE